MDIIEKKTQQETQFQQISNNSNELNNKKIILILVLFIMIVGVVSALYIKDRKIQKRIKGLQIETLKGLTERDVDILSEASNKELLKNKQDNCDTKSAEEKKECLEMLKSLQVTILEDENLCEELDSQKDQCFKNLAINKKNLDICNKIEDNNLKQFCVNSIYQYQAQEDGNLELCNKIEEDSQKEACIESVFKYIGSIEMCNSEYIINADLVDKCKSITLLKKVKSRKDLEVCSQIPLDEYKEECIKFVKE